jgi:hypothetical protein
VIYQSTFVDVAFKVNKYKENKQMNNSETEPINARCVVQLTQLKQSLCQEMCRMVALSTSLHTHQQFVCGTKFCWRNITNSQTETHTYSFFPVLSFYFRRLLYSVLCCLFMFYSLHFLPPPLNFAALGDRLV